MRSKSILVLGAVFGLVIFGVVPQKAVAVINFDDGGVHNIDYTINDDVWVDYQSPGKRTTINWLDGGVLPSPYSLVGYEDSVLNVYGGSIEPGLYARDNSQVNVSGGSMWALQVTDNCKVDISGGSIDWNLYAYHNSQVEISGGSIRFSLIAEPDSQVTISGGSIGESIRAGQHTWDNSIITIIGSDFAINGTSVGYGEFGTDGWNSVSGTLTGTLANGDYLNNEIYIWGDSKIVLAPIPAPGALLLGSIGVGLVGWMRRRSIIKQT